MHQVSLQNTVKAATGCSAEGFSNVINSFYLSAKENLILPVQTEYFLWQQNSIFDTFITYNSQAEGLNISITMLSQINSNNEILYVRVNYKVVGKQNLSLIWLVFFLNSHIIVEKILISLIMRKVIMQQHIQDSRGAKPRYLLRTGEPKDIFVVWEDMSQ